MAKAKVEAAKATLNMTMAEEFDAFLATDIELQSQIGRLRKKVGTNMAAWEAVGGDADDIREGRRLDKEGLTRLQRVTRVAGYMGLIEVDKRGQANFIRALDPDAKPMPTTQTQDGRAALARADTDGWNSGWAGGTVGDNPHLVGSEIWSIWDRACRGGIDAKAEHQAVKDRGAARKADVAPEIAPEAESPAAAAPRKGRKSKAAAEAPAPAPAPTPDSTAADDDQTFGDDGILSAFDMPGLPN